MRIAPAGALRHARSRNRATRVIVRSVLTLSLFACAARPAVRPLPYQPALPVKGAPADVVECTARPESQEFLRRLHARVMESWEVPASVQSSFSEFAVTARIEVDADGRLTLLEILEGSPPGAVESVRDAILAMRRHEAPRDRASCLTNAVVRLTFEWWKDRPPARESGARM